MLWNINYIEPIFNSFFQLKSCFQSLNTFAHYFCSKNIIIREQSNAELSIRAQWMCTKCSIAVDCVSVRKNISNVVYAA